MKTARKVLSILLALSLVLLFVAPSFFTREAHAATFTEAKVTISDSRAAQTNVTYAFSLGSPTATGAIKTIDIYFCTTGIGDCTPSGMDTDPDNDGIPISVETIDGDSPTAAQIGGDNHTIRITVGTPAAQTTDPLTFTFTGITNESTPNISNYARIVTYDDVSAPIDEATVAMAVLATDSIYVTADVQPIFTFTVAHVDSGALADVNGTELTVTSTDSTVPFGTLTADTPAVAAHDITIKSNATNGYQVTVQADDDQDVLVDGTTGNNIDTYTGTNAVPVVWTGPTSETKNDNTGLFGYTTEDAVLSGVDPDRFTSNKWAGPTTTAAELMYNAAAPGNGTGDMERVGWQIEVDTWQPPGSYTGSMVLIATPTY